MTACRSRWMRRAVSPSLLAPSLAITCCITESASSRERMSGHRVIQRRARSRPIAVALRLSPRLRDVLAASASASSRWPS